MDRSRVSDTESSADLGSLATTPVPLGVAKYAHLRARMAEAIETGRWPPGLQLPPELEIASRTGFSLGTVQRALRELVAQDYVVRRQGSGTFVADRRKRMEEPLHCRFVPRDGNTVLPVYTRVVARHRTAETGPWTDVLGRDTDGVVVFDRTIEIGGRFQVASRMYVGARQFSRLLTLPKRRLEGVNIKKLLAEEFGTYARRVQQRMRIEKPPQEIADWIGIDHDTCVLAIRATGVDTAGKPLYYQLLWAPPSDEELLISSLVE